MQREAPAMTVRQNLGELINEVQYRHDRIVITKAGPKGERGGWFPGIASKPGRPALNARATA